MRKKFKKAVAVILTAAMAVTATAPAFAAEETKIKDELNLQYENYIAEDGFRENGSYTIKGIRYEYEQHNTLNGEMYLDVYKVSNSRGLDSTREKTQEIYVNLNEGLMISNGEEKEIVLSNEVMPRGPIYTNVFTGNTFVFDVVRYTVEELALAIIGWSFAGIWGVGIGLVLGVANDIIEGYSGTFALDYERYVTTELFPDSYPGCSALHTYYCKYYNNTTGAFLRQSETYTEVVM